MHYKDLLSFDTTLTADAVEWQPQLPGGTNPKILACATYFLDKKQTQRLGSLHILDITASIATPLTRLDYPTSGILDFKWLDHDRLLTIDSSNTLDLLKYSTHPSATLNLTSRLGLGNDSIGLLIDFTTTDNSSFKILTSDTKGILYFTSLTNERLQTVDTFKGHDLEAWSVHMDRFNPNLVYSGADDCTLKMWDMREASCHSGKAALEWRLFEGGVTCVLQAERRGKLLAGYCEESLLCGSYDERIAVLDRRSSKRAVGRSGKLGGGVWRMRLHPERDLIVSACMHSGAHVVDGLSLASEVFYEGHGTDNLVYGCDWRVGGGEEMVATCSFYNHELRVWKVETGVGKDN